MKLKFTTQGGTAGVYTALKNIRFVAETDVMSGEAPIGQLSVEAKTTTDELQISDWITLTDDGDNVWCKYWVTDINRINAEYIQIEASSMLVVLDRLEMDPEFYDDGEGMDIAILAAVAEATQKYGTIIYIDPEFVNNPRHMVYGYFPKQSAKERLHTICFACGAYIKTFFTDVIEVLPVPSTATLIPANKTFYRPTLEYDDLVTELSITAFSFAQGTPSTTDEYVDDANGDHYIVTRQEFKVTNPHIPARCLENPAKVELMCITSDNVTDVLTQLSAYLFSRVRVKADVLDAGEYLPGGKYTINTGVDFATGWMKSADFTFGHGSKATVEIGSSEEVEGAELVIYDVNQQDEDIGERHYTLPVGYAYQIQNKYLDVTIHKHRYIYYPEDEYISGTLPSGGDTKFEYYNVALDNYKKRLSILNVDECNITESVVLEIE